MVDADTRAWSWLERELAAAAVQGEAILQFFTFGHLPEHLATTSREFAQLALSIYRVLPRNPERTVALRKLLEAKDCAVRAQLFKPTPATVQEIVLGREQQT